MKKKHNFQLNSKHLFVIMTIVCISLLMTTFASDFSLQPLKTGAGYVVVPFEKGINKVGDWLVSIGDNFRDVKQLSSENKELQNRVDELKEENNRLALNQKKLERYEELYATDQEYSDYPKIMADVIAKDPGNWYSSFTIDKGTNDGVDVDMNVIASGGLVGLVVDAGPSWATVQSIIDDGNNVSGMTIANSDTCIVTGNLELMDSNKMRFSQMQSQEAGVSVGENIVTSNISDKYLKGILIGTISSVSMDSNNLTSTGYLIPAVDFRHLEEVLVITQKKEGSDNDQ